MTATEESMLIRLTPNAPVVSVSGMEIKAMPNQALTEHERMVKARARRKRSKRPIFQKISKGLYISHEFGMTLSHEMVWSKDIGRRWELTFHITSGMGLMAPSKHSKKFDTMQEAREYANALARG